MNRTPAEALADLVSGGLELDPYELNGILREVWPQMHGPLYRHDTGTVIALFKRAGYVADGVPCPAGDLTVYRGEPVASGQRGISWTTDRRVAMKYGRDYSTVGDVHVLRATAPVASVLARFTFEDEVVVEPALLTGAAEVWRMPRFTLSLKTWP